MSIIAHCHAIDIVCCSLSYHYSQSGDKNVTKAFKYSSLSVDSLCRDGAFELILPYVEAAWKSAVTKSHRRTLKRILEKCRKNVRDKISHSNDRLGASSLLTMIDDRLSVILDTFHQERFGLWKFLPCVASICNRSALLRKVSCRVHAQS